MISKWLNWVMAWAGIMLAFAMVIWCGCYLVSYKNNAGVIDWLMLGYGVLVSIWLAAKTLGRIAARGTRQPIFYGYQPKKSYGNGKLPKSR